ncbi:hypothetical protein [Halorussus sp. MSC15.2]|uniref:DUF7282 domain-containing protein n=1 Tax=Halorussus sp. MSC15.2 TaxID=2283638 RepID=UPI0013D6422C|nr:hypothetical protein [Halorussus sp. MSC15.2]NEU56820.1 hypothetical protein [Halorussus sp. MSC15.2]
MTRKIAILAVVALVVAGTSAALAASGGPSAATGDASLAQETTTVADDNETTAEETMAEQETTTAEGQVGAESARITFLNQSAGFTFTGGEPNQTTVLIERVVVPEGGFVAIHEATNVSGVYATEGQVSVGAVVGNSTYLEPGVHSNVVVELNETVNESKTLVAMAHRDTNDNQQYDFPGADEPYTRNGSPVIDTGYIIVEYDVIDLTFGETTTEAANETTTEA